MIIRSIRLCGLHLLRRLLAGGHSTIAGRLAGAFRGMGRTRMANDIIGAMRAAGFTVRESDPVGAPAPALETSRAISPSAHRIRLMWETMRDRIPERFPRAPVCPEDVLACLERIEDAYVTDAHHSLSIEGYRVSPALIEAARGSPRIRSDSAVGRG